MHARRGEVDRGRGLIVPREYNSYLITFIWIKFGYAVNRDCVIKFVGRKVYAPSIRFIVICFAIGLL